MSIFQNSKNFQCGEFKKFPIRNILNLENLKLASSAEYHMPEQFKNCQYLEPNFGLPY